MPGLKSTGTVNSFAASSKSTAPTAHGALIPSAASNNLAVMPLPVSLFNQPKSYPLEFSESHTLERLPVVARACFSDLRRRNGEDWLCRGMAD